MNDKVANSDQTSLQWFYCSKSGGPEPITFETLRDLLRQGAVSHDTLVWNETFGPSWKRLGDTAIVIPIKKISQTLPPPLPVTTDATARRRPIEIVAALLAAIVLSAVLVAIGSISFQACLYASITFAAASLFLFIKPISKLHLTRFAGGFLLAIACVAGIISTGLLQWQDHKLRAACLETRNISGCTLIIQDQRIKSKDRVVAYRNRGVAYHNISQYDHAISDYSEAIALKDDDATVYYNRGLAYHANGDKVRAIADYTEAITRDSKYESELEADFRSIAPEVYESLIAKARAKREQLRKEEIAGLKAKLTSSLGIDDQHKIYVRLMELEPSNEGYKREGEKIAKQIAARDEALRAAEEKKRRDAEQAKAQLNQCRSDWTKCVDNAQLVNNFSGWIDAQVACKMEANNQARFGDPVWPWLSFSSFYKGKEYISSGKAFVIEPDAKFQNGFGAMVRSQVICTYDLKAKRVISIDVSPR